MAASRVLMISGEYPPMKGGVGRYTSNLVKALRAKGLHVDVASNLSIESDEVHGATAKGDRQNSKRLLKLVSELKPDIVNIQYERGLYEMDTTIKHIIQRLLYGSTLTEFYQKCPVPTISTLHTVMPQSEYRAYISERARRKEGRFANLPAPIRTAIRRWVLEQRYNLLFETVALSTEVICPARILQEIVNRGELIYHGAQPATLPSDKEKLRREFNLPGPPKKILLAFGYVGSYKGFDLLDNLKLPDGWSLVVKQNRHERGLESPVKLQNAINLELGHLDEQTLSRLFFACDAIIFPYRVVSISGVMFDALAHGLPFVSSDLRFFKEFADLGLGIATKRDAESLSVAINNLATDYSRYYKNVSEFASSLSWDNIADKHIMLYSRLAAARPRQGDILA